MLQFARNSFGAWAPAMRPLARTASAVSTRGFAAVPEKTGYISHIFHHTKFAAKGSRQLAGGYSVRSYSVLTQNAAKEYKYKDVKELTERAGADNNDTLLIDVREPAEFHEGHIPGALNVPFKSSPGAFDLPEEDFEESFGFAKPKKDQQLVFYCLGGVRLTAAEELANSFGYTKRGNYVGSYEDWVTHENAAKRA